jgi:hypothetical protein
MRSRLAELPLEHRLGVVPYWEQVSVAPSHRRCASPDPRDPSTARLFALMLEVLHADGRNH